MWYKNIAGRFFGLVTKHACDRRTDKRTDVQNYDSQDSAGIAASRGKNRWLPNEWPGYAHGVTTCGNHRAVIPY